MSPEIPPLMLVQDKIIARKKICCAVLPGRQKHCRLAQTIGLILWMWFYHIAAVAQPDALRFISFSTRQGLANNLVNDIIRDSFGFVWAYTPGGISRFDGIEFKTYKFPYYGYDRNNLAVDAKGNLWATDGIDLYLFYCESDRFGQIVFPNASKEGLAFIHNNRGDKETWFRAGNDLYKIEPASLSIRSIKKGLPQADPAFNYRDKKGRFWFGAQGQVQVYHPKQDSVTRFFFGNNNWAHRFIEDDDERIWASIGGSGLMLFDLTSHLIRPYRKQYAQNSYFDLAMNPALSGDSVIWTNGKFYEGIQLFSKKRRKFVGSYQHDPLNDQSLVDNVTYKVYVDHEGVLWTGTAGGFSVLHPRRQDVVRYLFPDHPANMITPFIYRDRHKAVDDALVFFDPHKLLYYYQGRARSLKNHKLGLWSKVSGTLAGCFDPAGRLWLGTSTGLHRMDRERGEIAESFIISATGDMKIGLLLPDQSDNIWFDTSGRLVKWNLLNRKMTTYSVVSGGDSSQFQPDDYLIKKTIDGNGMLWFSTYSSILHFNPVTGKIIRRYNFPDLPPLNRRPARIIDFNLDNRGNVWLGLHNGLVKVDSLTGKSRLIFFPDNDTLSTGHLNNILIDDGGNIWSATYSGVYCYLPDADRFVCLDEKNDLSSNIVDRIGWVGARIFAYHANGKIDIINPELALKPLPVPPVYITGFQALDRKIPCDWSGRSSHPMRLSYRDNIITFLYTAVDFVAPQKVTYQYRLDGFDDDWYEAGTHREATYTNLSGGHYIFRVRAINGDGVISPREAVMRIYVQPPYWGTWWFRVLLGLVFITFVYAIFRYRELQRLEQEKLRLRIARDLHDDMGSTLSSISILSEAALRNLQQDIDRTRFGAIGERARQVMEAMSDIVWSVNPRNDNMENVLQRMKEFAVEILEPQGIVLHFNADEAVKNLNLAMEKRKDFYLLFKEAVNNTAKYSGALEVWVTVQADDRSLRLEVRDNGRGFDPEQMKRGNGLWNMQRRAERMGGAFVLESTVGEGTRVEVRM